MPHYRVIAYTPDLEQAVHPNIEASDPMAAAVAVCGGPLMADGSDGAELVAHVAPMDRPVDLRLFYRPRS
jgi:hypothetical protein